MTKITQTISDSSFLKVFPEIVNNGHFSIKQNGKTNATVCSLLLSGKRLKVKEYMTESGSVFILPFLRQNPNPIVTLDVDYFKSSGEIAFSLEIKVRSLYSIKGISADTLKPKSTIMTYELEVVSSKYVPNTTPI